MDSNYFANLIAAAPVQTTSRYFEAGVYAVKVDAAKIFVNRQRRPRAAVDCTVLQSNNPNFPATSQVSWVITLDSDSGPSEIKTFIVALTGCTEAEAANPEVINKFFPNTIDNANMEPSVAIGLHAIVNAFEKTTKSGGIFTKCSWKRFDPQADEMPDFSSMPRVTAADNVPAASSAPVEQAESGNAWGGQPAAQANSWGGQPSQQSGNGGFPY